MLRRTFFKSVCSNLALVLIPKWARAQSATVQAEGVSLNDVALVVLPDSLGAKKINEATMAFQKWVFDYHAGADAGYGYGITHPRVLGPNPSAHYTENLKQLDAAAAAKGGRFVSLSNEDKRTIVQAELSRAGAKAIPSHPNGTHVVTDLMSHFYNSSDGMDFCYNAAIRRSDCRGLPSSSKRPAALS